jgi:glycosyltransferase involved in cell wall biosynthesis
MNEERVRPKPRRQGARIVVAGAFPPPVHGFSNAMQAVFSVFRANGADPVKVVTSMGAEGSVIGRILRALFGATAGIGTILRESRRCRVYYTGLAGGSRQIFDAAFLLTAKLCRMRCVLHHHSFAYISQSNTLAKICFRLAGRDACHVALCRCMADQLQKRYGLREPIRVISNAALIDLPTMAAPRPGAEQPLTIGYISSISHAKGADTFLQIARELALENLKIVFRAAGPPHDEELSTQFRELAQEASYFQYAGPVYGLAKEEFYGSLDILLFPTIYVNEAEPIVILEAMSSGAVVIANDRGCIRSMIGSKAGVVAPDSSTFRSIAVDRIRHWSRDRAALNAISLAATDRARELRNESLKSLDELIDSML